MMIIVTLSAVALPEGVQMVNQLLEYATQAGWGGYEQTQSVSGTYIELVQSEFMTNREGFVYAMAKQIVRSQGQE